MAGLEAGGIFCAKTSVTGQASPRFKGKEI